jgi:hypothetical protein
LPSLSKKHASGSNITVFHHTNLTIALFLKLDQCATNSSSFFINNKVTNTFFSSLSQIKGNASDAPQHQEKGKG